MGFKSKKKKKQQPATKGSNLSEKKTSFTVDMRSYLNTPNTQNKRLRRKGKIALQMLKDVLAFEHKLTVFTKDVQRGKLLHFPSLREFKEDTVTVLVVFKVPPLEFKLHVFR